MWVVENSIVGKLVRARLSRMYQTVRQTRADRKLEPTTQGDKAEANIRRHARSSCSIGNRAGDTDSHSFPLRLTKLVLANLPSL